MRAAEKLRGGDVKLCPKRRDDGFTATSPENSQIMHHLASLLIPQEIFPQSLVIVDTRLLRKFPFEINILRDLGADL